MTVSPTSSSTAWRRWWPPLRPARSSCTPGTAEPFSPEQPGRLVFDLDPAPDVAFDEVIEARSRKSATGSRSWGSISFCKTTGGKGLHVVTPA